MSMVDNHFLNIVLQVDERGGHEGRHESATWVFATVYLPCSGRGPNTLAEAVDEIESVIVNAPRCDHMVLIGDYNAGGVGVGWSAARSSARW